MQWYQTLSCFLSNELRLLFGIYLISKLTDFSLKKYTLLISSLAGFIITVFQIISLPIISIITIEIIIMSTIVCYHNRRILRSCLFLIFFYEIGIGLWDFLISSLLAILFHSKQFISLNATEYIISILLIRLSMVTAILLEKLNYKITIFSNHFISIICILGLLGTVTLSEQTLLPLDEDKITTWIILSMILMFAVLFYRVNKQREMELEIARLKQEQSEILERDYEALSCTYADNAKLYHDMHNHIETIYQCLMQGNVSDAIKYCEDLRTPAKEISQSVWTGDKVIDYLISSKISIAKQNHIKTKVNIEYPHNTNIRNIDFTTILGNLMDNALEAANEMPENLRFINLTIRRINSMLVIKVENGYCKAPIKENGTLITSKADKVFHGWGLKSIKTAAEKYDGTINTKYDNGVFKSVVTLSFKPIKI